MSSPTTVDLVLLGARLWSPSGVPDGADSIAVGDGRIVAVGRRVDVAGMAGPGTRSVDLTGRMLLPAFQDAHVHPILGGLDRLACDLSEVPERPEAYVDAVRRYADAHPREAWIVGAGWNAVAFPGGEPPPGLLDAAVPDRPVFLSSYDGHSGWANTAALAIAGIDASTEDPPLGRIGRAADGTPTGVLYELAMAIVARHVPDPTPEEVLEGLATGQAYLHDLGITAWQDATVSPERLTAYLTAEARGSLTGRVSASLEWDETRGLEQIDELLELSRSVPAGSRVRATTIKVFQDGVIESRTASMLEPYLDGHGRPTGERGESRVDPETLAAAVTRLEAAGMQVHVHAIGDRAVREALDAFATARELNGLGAARRHHIAHLQCVDPADIPRFAALGVTANVQPYWAAEDNVIRDLTRPFVGDERTDRMYPFASLLRAGARLAMGSDWNVSTADPLKLMDVAVHRVPLDARDAPVFVPSERLALEDCLKAFTAGSAYVNHLDAETGELAPGRLADLVILDRDLLAPDAGPPAEARLLATLVDGRPVQLTEDLGLDRAGGRG